MRDVERLPVRIAAVCYYALFLLQVIFGPLKTLGKSRPGLRTPFVQHLTCIKLRIKEND